MDDAALEVDEIGLVGAELGEEHIAGRGAGLVPDQAAGLFDGGHHPRGRTFLSSGFFSRFIDRGGAVTAESTCDEK
jgi:hypothetical protein